MIRVALYQYCRRGMFSAAWKLASAIWAQQYLII